MKRLTYPVLARYLRRGGAEIQTRIIRNNHKQCGARRCLKKWAVQAEADTAYREAKKKFHKALNKAKDNWMGLPTMRRQKQA